MVKQKFVYEAKVVEVHDGDTITAELDLGFDLKSTIKIRLFGLNAPELKKKDEANKTIENPLGTKSRDELRNLLPDGSTIVIETIKDSKEKFGRYLGNIYAMQGKEQVLINDYLITNGFAVKMKY